MLNSGFCNSIKDLEAKLETYASKIFMARAILESIIPAFISVLIGPWSDKFGRRPILLSTFCGEFETQSGLLNYSALCVSLLKTY